MHTTPLGVGLEYVAGMVLIPMVVRGKAWAYRAHSEISALKFPFFGSSYQPKLVQSLLSPAGQEYPL